MVKPVIGIRREDKNIWERRAPIVPEHVAALVREHGVEVLLQKSDLRVIPAADYARAGAQVVEDLSPCRVIFAVKEIPLALLQKGKTYVFFSHTIKGQAHNMPMLRRMMELGCQLIDYEKLVDEQGRRLVFFGRHAGLAGMIDTLWALGRRLEWENIPSPFAAVKRAYQYADLGQARAALTEVGRRISAEGLPEALVPFVIGFTGYGHVSKGAQELMECLPTRRISPSEFGALRGGDRRAVYQVEFKEEHMFEPAGTGRPFDLQDYFRHPEGYRSRFEPYLPHLSVLVNGIYWEARCPKLVTKEYLKRAYAASPRQRLKVIGDITCDLEGSIECNVKSMDPGNPVFTYDPLRDAAADGCAGDGPVVLAVDNLPAELPREASRDFSAALMPFVPEIAKADTAAALDACGFSEPVRKATILYQGRLTPGYRYLEKHLS